MMTERAPRNRAFLTGTRFTGQLAVLALLFMPGIAGVASATTVAIAVAPATAKIETAAKQQFKATVTGSTDTAVKWTVNKIAGGNKTVGTISTAGLYTAPSAPPSPATVTVTATSEANTAKFASSTVTISKPSAGFSISSLGETTIEPFAVLTIDGSGFEPASAAISILLTPESGGAPITIPVTQATATTLKIAAPLYLNPTTGKFTAGSFSVQALQLRSGSLSTSNVVTGLEISAPPEVPSTLPVGTVTSVFLTTSLNVSSTVQAAAASKPRLNTLAADLFTYSGDMNKLLAAVKKIVADPTATVILPTANGPAFTLNAKVLTLSDQLLWTRAVQFAAQAHVPATEASSFALTDPASPCTTADQVECYGAAYLQSMTQHTPSQVALAADVDSFLSFGSLGQWASQGLAAAGAVTDEAAAALQVGWTAASSYFAAFATAATPPAVPVSPNNTAESVVENIALGGKGILPAALDAAVNNQDAKKLLAASANAPQGGALLTGSQFNVHVGDHVVDLFEIVGSSPTVTEYDAPDEESDDPTGDALIDPEISSGTYGVTGNAVVGSFTCCYPGVGCTTVPSQSSTAFDPIALHSTISLSQLTAAECSKWASAVSGSGCGSPGCDCGVGTDSFQCSFSCTVPPLSASCSAAAVTTNFTAVKQ
jgi:hypothetical protein